MGILQSVALLTLFLQGPSEVDLLVVGKAEVAAEALRLKVRRIGLAGERLVGVRQLAGYKPIEVHRVGNRIAGLTFGRGSVKVRVPARIVVDATGDLDVFRLAGDGTGSDWCLVEGMAGQCLGFGSEGLLAAKDSAKLAARLASLALHEGLDPRAYVADRKRVASLQLVMLRESGVALWPYRDLGLADACYEAAEMLAAQGIVRMPEEFGASQKILRGEMYLAFQMARLRFTAGRGEGTKPATRRDLYDALREAGMEVSIELAAVESPQLTRGEFAIYLWGAIKDSLLSPPPSRRATTYPTGPPL